MSVLVRGTIYAALGIATAGAGLGVFGAIEKAAAPAGSPAAAVNYGMSGVNEAKDAYGFIDDNLHGAPVIVHLVIGIPETVSKLAAYPAAWVGGTGTGLAFKYFPKLETVAKNLTSEVVEPTRPGESSAQAALLKYEKA